MQKNVQLSVIGLVAVSVLLLAASSLAPAAFAKKHHHGVSIKIHANQIIGQSQSCGGGSNCQQNAANAIQVGHDNSVNQANINVNVPIPIRGP